MNFLKCMIIIKLKVSIHACIGLYYHYDFVNKCIINLIYTYNVLSTIPVIISLLQKWIYLLLHDFDIIFYNSLGRWSCCYGNKLDISSLLISHTVLCSTIRDRTNSQNKNPTQHFFGVYNLLQVIFTNSSLNACSGSYW